MKISKISSGLFAFVILSCFFISSSFLDAQVKTTISEILSDPDKYDNKVVQVEGKVSKVEFRTSKKGNQYTTFRLYQGKDYIKVFSFGTLDVNDGETVIARGTFFKVKYVGRYTFYNELDVTKGEIIKK